MRNLRSLATLSFAFVTVVGLSACSGAKEDDEKLATEGEEAEAQGSAANEVAAAEPAPVAAPEPAAVETPAPAPAQGNATVDKNRVVRYVSGDQVTIAAEPKDGAPVVGKLVKGDRVLVVEQGGWGKIGDGMFVNLKNLSNKGVPAERQPAQWSKPAH